MTVRFETITTALRDDGVMRSVTDVTPQELKDHTFYCADCKLSHGRNVELTVRGGHFHDYISQKMDPLLAVPLVNPHGDPIEKSKTKWMDPMFVRVRGAEKHACGHDAAYSAFRSTAKYLSGQILDPTIHSYAFRVLPPKHGSVDQEVSDLPVRYQSKGIKTLGVRDARDFGKLLEHFQEHAGLQHNQYFTDLVHPPRRFNEVHFENASALYQYLQSHDAIGRGHAIVCSYLMNPNTSWQGRKAVVGEAGFVDRDVSKQEDGRKINITARATNAQTMEAFWKAATENGVSQKALVHVFGPCWIEDDYLNAKTHRVEIDLYDPRQIVPWHSPMRFVPPFKHGDGDSPVLAL